MVNTDIAKISTQENIESILSQINDLLQPHGISATAERENNYLYILLEATHVPDEQTMVALVSLGIINLDDPSITKIWIYGRPFGERFTAWSYKMDLTAGANGHIADNSLGNPAVTTKPKLDAADEITENSPFGSQEERF